MEKPEDKIMNEVETPEEKKFDWARDIRIEVPLNEFMKMKKKIMKLEQSVKDAKAEEMKEFSKRREAEETIAQLKDQIKEMLGIEEQKGDDGK